YKENNHVYGQIMIQNNLATTYLNFKSERDYPQAEQYLNASLDYSKKSNDVDLEYLSYFYLGSYFEKGKMNYQKAKEYYNRAFQLLKKGYKNDYNIELYKSLSRVYLKLGDYKNAY